MINAIITRTHGELPITSSNNISNGEALKFTTNVLPSASLGQKGADDQAEEIPVALSGRQLADRLLISVCMCDDEPNPNRRTSNKTPSEMLAGSVFILPQ